MKEKLNNFFVGAMTVTAIIVIAWAIRYHNAVLNLVMYPEAVGSMDISVKYLIKK